MRDARPLPCLKPSKMEYDVDTSAPMDFQPSETLSAGLRFDSLPIIGVRKDSILECNHIKRYDKKTIFLDKYYGESPLKKCPTNGPQEPPSSLLGDHIYPLQHRHDSPKGDGQKENFLEEPLSHSFRESVFEERRGFTSPLSDANDYFPQLVSSLSLGGVDFGDEACDVKREPHDGDFCFSRTEERETHSIPYDFFADSHRYSNGVHEDEMIGETCDQLHYNSDAACRTESSPSSCKDEAFSEYWTYDEEPLDLSIPKEEPSYTSLNYYSDCYDLSRPEFVSEGTEQQNSWLKKIKTGTRSRVRSPKSWEFLLRLLMDPKSNPSMIRWEDKSLGTFRLVQKDEIAKIWGMRSSKHKDGGLSYDNFARNLRYHYKTKMLVPVSEKHLVYKFSHEVMQKMYSSVN